MKFLKLPPQLEYNGYKNYNHYKSYMKILLIEDDPLMVKLYQKVFQREGYEVETAERGLAGLQKAKVGKPDLILLDIMMPEMDGFEVMTKLKEDQTTVNIPIIALTNLSGEQDAQKALQMGAKKYIVKSEHDPNEVVEIVKSVFNEKGSV